MSDELPGDPRDDVGDELTIIVSDGPDGPIVDTVLRDRSGVRGLASPPVPHAEA